MDNVEEVVYGATEKWYTAAIKNIDSEISLSEDFFADVENNGVMESVKNPLLKASKTIKEFFLKWKNYEELNKYFTNENAKQNFLRDIQEFVSQRDLVNNPSNIFITIISQQFFFIAQNMFIMSQDIINKIGKNKQWNKEILNDIGFLFERKISPSVDNIVSLLSGPFREYRKDIDGELDHILNKEISIWDKFDQWDIIIKFIEVKLPEEVLSKFEKDDKVMLDKINEDDTFTFDDLLTEPEVGTLKKITDSAKMCFNYIGYCKMFFDNKSLIN